MKLAETTFDDLERISTRIAELGRSGTSVSAVAQSVIGALAERYEGLVLGRCFLVRPLAAIPERDREFAQKVAGPTHALADTTRVLSLVGTHGRNAAWCDRLQSKGHLAIPLVNRDFVQGVPMLAKLLADLEVDLAALDTGAPIVTRQMLGGKNRAFYVEDAQTMIDAQKRFVIPSRDFVQDMQVRTVFGMGGAYADGTLVTMILFTQEKLDRMLVDRFPSLISFFKMATSPLMLRDHVYA